LRFIPGNSIVRTEINSTAQWEGEVRAWFYKSLIYGKLQIRAIAVNDLRPSEEYTNMPMNISLCKRILVTDSGYVNISWFWFWLTISSLLFVNFISLFYTIECLRVRWIYMKNLLVKSYLRLKKRNRSGDVPLDLDDWSAYPHRDSTATKMWIMLYNDGDNCLFCSLRSIGITAESGYNNNCFWPRTSFNSSRTCVSRRTSDVLFDRGTISIRIINPLL
jgi:hypothetical protein